MRTSPICVSGERGGPAGVITRPFNVVAFGVEGSQSGTSQRACNITENSLRRLIESPNMLIEAKIS